MAPFKYLSLVWAALLGFLFWGDVPDVLKLGGAALVVASGSDGREPTDQSRHALSSTHRVSTLSVSANQTKPAGSEEMRSMASLRARVSATSESRLSSPSWVTRRKSAPL